MIRLMEDGNKVVWINPDEIAAIHELPQAAHEPAKCQVNMTSGACFRFLNTPDELAATIYPRTETVCNG